MLSRLSTAAFAALSLVQPSLAFIRFGCAVNLVEERLDPVVDPGAVSAHAHKIAGGSGFAATMDYAKARSASCSSCPIKADLSNYWTPKLYYQFENGTFQSVPTVGDNAQDQVGGMTVYYLQRGPDPSTLKAFPEGFRMLAGDTTKRTFSNDFAGQGVSYACLGANQPETNQLPSYNCPGGLRAQIFFPSCWDGQNLDSDDHRSHMSYPATGAYNSGTCPSSHPVQLVSLFFEVLYNTNQFKDMWHGNTQPFVFSNGDPTGYGFHGDFVNGWDVDVLQQVVSECTDPNAQGVIDSCGPIANKLFTQAEQSACRIPKVIDEQVAGVLPALPGCNPIQSDPGAAIKSTCEGQTQATIGNGPQSFTDVLSKGWGYVGCAVDNIGSRTLTGKNTGADGMTVPQCMDLCQGFTYAGLEYGRECWCGNAVAAERMPKAGLVGGCTMMCSGNGTQFCGGAGALNLYQKGTQNVGGSSGGAGTSPISVGSGSSPSGAPVVVPSGVPSGVPSVVPSVVPSAAPSVSIPGNPASSPLGPIGEKPVSVPAAKPSTTSAAVLNSQTLDCGVQTVTVTENVATVTVTKYARRPGARRHL